MSSRNSSWRGQKTLGPQRPEPLASALSGFLEKSGLNDAIARLTVVDDWPRIVGPRIGKVTRALEVRGDALLIEVTSSAWLNELAMIRVDLLARINEDTSRPPIERIVFRLAEEPVDHNVADDRPIGRESSSTPTKRA